MLLLSIAGCDTVEPCRDGTLFLDLTLPSGSGADHFRADISYGDKTLQANTSYAGQTPTRWEITFPDGYPTGQKATVTVTASQGSTDLASVAAPITFDVTCTRLPLSLSLVSVDLGSNVDLASPDLAVSAPPLLELLAGQIGGPGNADGTGAAARFSGPFGVASDGAGNIYVADSNNHAIRRVVLATGAVTTIAGQVGVKGSADGTGTAAQFNYPRGVASDRAGNLYVADFANHTIRQIALATGAVTTPWGQPGSSGSSDGMGNAARFNQPSGVVIDGTGNLYVADTGNHTIRQIVSVLGAVNTLAGQAGVKGSADGTGAAAQFNTPLSVALDGAGNLYVADANNATIRKIVLTNAAVTTLAGQAGLQGSTDGTGTAARFWLPVGVIGDGAGNLYVTDDSNNQVRKIVLATAAVTTLAGQGGMAGSTDGTGTAALFNNPSGIAVDGPNLYVTDTDNHTIRKIVLATAAVTTLAGLAPKVGSWDGMGAAARLNYPTGIASDGAGNLYVADTGNGTIRKIVPATALVTTLAPFSLLNGVASDGAANLYVAANQAIYKVTLPSGSVAPLAGKPGSPGAVDGTGSAAQFSYPSGMAGDGAGNLYVADVANHTIRKIVLATGAVTTPWGLPGNAGSTDGTGSAARFNQPLGMASDGADNMYVTDNGNHTIRKIVLASGAVTTPWGLPGSAGSSDGMGNAARFNQPIGVAGDGAGNLYVTESGNHTIRKIVLATGTVSTLAGVAGRSRVQLGPLPAGHNLPGGIAVTPHGDVASTSSNENAALIIRAP